MKSLKQTKGYQQLSRFFRNMSIRNKFISIFVPILVVLVVMILLLTNTFLYNSNIAKTKAIVEDECEIIQVRLESMKSNLITCSNIIAKDINRIYSDTNVGNSNDISFVSIKNNIYTALDYDKRCFAEIDSILFVDEKGNMVSVGLTMMPELEEIQAQLLGEIPEKGLPRSVQYPVERRTYFDSEEPVLTIGKRIIMMDTGKSIGHIFLNVKESNIASIFPAYQGDGTERQFYLADAENRVVAAMDKESLLTTLQDDSFLEFTEESGTSSEIKMDKKHWLFTKKKVENLDWNLISQISIGSLTADIRVTSGFTIMLGILGIVMAVFLTMLLSKLITKPIGVLTNAAGRLQDGDFSVNCEIDSKDEVGIFSKAFQTMIRRIEGLMCQIQEEQKQKREYELALIQAQIKPHFLYNTLDLIYIFSESNMPREAGKVTKSLADFYRTSLSSGEEIITIGEEIKNVENYLFIQRERYFDLIDYVISVDALMEEYQILKLTLQPLVENAIYHGIKQKGQKGTIEVIGMLEEESVVLIVKDNGSGMKQERIREIMAENGSGKEKPFGMRNVKQRLKLYYGGAADMQIHSVVNQGTEITIRVPRTVGEELC